MVDKHLFSKYPISTEILESNIPFIDIGIPEDYKLAQTVLKNLLWF